MRKDNNLRKKTDYFLKIIIRVKNDSPIDFIYFKIYKLFDCIISILLLTNFIPTNLCLIIIQHKT